jgi:DNA-directed RNA polymerase subunit M/transcription elongation factor TFIIS
MASLYPKIDTVADILKKCKFNFGVLNDTQIGKLLRLKFKEEELFTLRDREFLNDAVGLIDELGFDNALEYFKIKHNYDERKEIIKNSMPYNNAKRLYFLEVTEKIRQLNNTVDSIYDCAKCGSKKVKTVLKQTRRADEGITEFNTCLSCGFSWRN